MKDPLEIRLESPAFGTDDIHVFRLVGNETFSQAFRFEIESAVPEPIAQKLGNVGLKGSATVQRLLGSYGKRPMIAQFKESDLSFVSRLCEHLGIFFFFEHGDDGDQIVFGDYNGACRPVPGAE